ncbi:hypothetical protein AB0L71_16025 [Streptomyces sp. NPDC052052]
MSAGPETPEPTPRDEDGPVEPAEGEQRHAALLAKVREANKQSASRPR